LRTDFLSVTLEKSFPAGSARDRFSLTDSFHFIYFIAGI